MAELSLLKALSLIPSTANRSVEEGSVSIHSDATLVLWATVMAERDSGRERKRGRVWKN